MSAPVVNFILNPFRKRRAATPFVELCYHQLCGIEFPIPATERGWLHVRTFTGAWDVVGLRDRLAGGLWLSASYPDEDAAEAALNDATLKPHALAGYWPGGGFVEVTLVRNAELEDHARFLLRAFGRTPAVAEALLEQLRARHLLTGVAEAAAPRIALVNSSYGSLDVQRVPVREEHLVPRSQVDLFYGDGASAWVDAWAHRLAERRYGLTILSGEPGTGKTTLLRSAAAWLSRTHAFYFMPASRFSGVDAGELVTFWVGENKHSRLRNVLVLEDAESILLRREGDNRERVAALLNLTDGVMGDALGLQIVCTLNSDLADLDPALLRPGRLLAQRVFGRLDANTAARLAAHLGKPVPEGDEVSLAELFNPPGPAIAPAATPRRARLGFATESAS